MLTHSACSSGPERRLEDTHSTIRWNTTTIEVHVSESRNSEAFLLLHNLAAMHLIFWLVHLDYTVLLTWGCKLSIERISFRYTVTCTGAVYAGFRCCAWNCYHSPDLLTEVSFVSLESWTYMYKWFLLKYLFILLLFWCLSVQFIADICTDVAAAKRI
jgi:hypothetical protein